ncbi:MAG: vanadium-dependent haloperoxidase [Pseudomonadota bacterium]
MADRRQDAHAKRLEAAELARTRKHKNHEANGDEQRFAGDRYFMSFTKGLPHNPKTGLLQDPTDFVKFRRAIDEGHIDPFTTAVRHGAKYEVNNAGDITKTTQPPGNFRQWEAPTAGVALDLQGPDAQAVTMAPAPPLLGPDGSANPELVFEMAEVYEMAILRDVPFSAFEAGQDNAEVTASLERLNQLPYVATPDGRPRKLGESQALTAQTVFRGSSPGVDVGPYLSQFMILGNTDFNDGSVSDGKIRYGVLEIDQRVPVATRGVDYMQCMKEFVDVQRGLRPPRESYENDNENKTLRRFITTPRDLATYVHYDALYEAYLNACLMLLVMEAPTDPACDHLTGTGAGSSDPSLRPHSGGFALYGGPHILTLVTEVATRALKAVRYQKFNNHIRLRPEALAGRIEVARRVRNGAQLDVPEAMLRSVSQYCDALESNGTLSRIAQLNNGSSCTDDHDQGSYFLPMAFPEGSPMHPAYGAGHATVAGACVTILKAFFDTNAVLAKFTDGNGMTQIAFKTREARDKPVQYRVADDSGQSLDETAPCEFLTLEGELNKLAANISIGRNAAGVHYFTDYYDSVRMGEEIAIGILEEQALTYPTDPFVLSVQTFDGHTRRIGHA